MKYVMMILMAMILVIAGVPEGVRDARADHNPRLTVPNGEAMLDVAGFWQVTIWWDDTGVSFLPVEQPPTWIETVEECAADGYDYQVQQEAINPDANWGGVCVEIYSPYTLNQVLQFVVDMFHSQTIIGQGV